MGVRGAIGGESLCMGDASMNERPEIDISRAVARLPSTLPLNPSPSPYLNSNIQ